MKRNKGKQSKPTVTIEMVSLPKERLARLPATERQLLLLLGHAENEISFISKLVVMCRQRRPTIHVISKLGGQSRQRFPRGQLMEYAQAAQILILLRVLIGKLHEAWEL